MFATISSTEVTLKMFKNEVGCVSYTGSYQKLK